MGECGCGTVSEFREVVTIGHLVLAVEVYTGCVYCSTGIMVTLYLMTKKNAGEWMLGEITKKFKPDEFGMSQIDIPIIGPDDLKEASEKLDNMEHYATLQDWLNDYGLQLLQNGVHIRKVKTLKFDKRNQDAKPK